MRFHHGGSEDPLRGHQKSKVRSKAPQEGPSSISGAPSVAQTAFANCLPGLLWWFLLGGHICSGLDLG